MGQRDLVRSVELVDLVNTIRRGYCFAATQQLLCYVLQGETFKAPECGAQQFDSIEYGPTWRACNADLTTTRLHHYRLIRTATKRKRDTELLAFSIQKIQIEVNDIPADQHIRIKRMQGSEEIFKQRFFIFKVAKLKAFGGRHLFICNH